MWDLTTGKRIKSIQIDRVNQISFHPTALIMSVASEDGCFSYDLETFDLIKQLSGEACKMIDFDIDGDNFYAIYNNRVTVNHET